MIQTLDISISPTTPITTNLSLFHEFSRRQMVVIECSVSWKQRHICVLDQILLVDGTIFSLAHRHTQRQSTINIQGLLQAGFNIVYHRNDHFTSSNISLQLSGSSIKHQFILPLCGPHLKKFSPYQLQTYFIIISNSGNNIHVAFIVQLLNHHL